MSNTGPFKQKNEIAKQQWNVKWNKISKKSHETKFAAIAGTQKTGQRK